MKYDVCVFVSKVIGSLMEVDGREGGVFLEFVERGSYVIVDIDVVEFFGLFLY